MRKTFLIISLVAVFALGANAQPRDFRIGLKLGPSFDWASAGSTATKSGPAKLGFNMGLVADYHLSEHFAFSTGANLNLMRMKYTFTDKRYVEDFLEKNNVPISRQLKSNVVEVPLKLKVKIDLVDSFLAYVEAGGALGVNYKDLAKDDYTFYWVSESGQEYVDVTSQYRLLQASMVFGLGAEFEINYNLSVFAQLSFDHSFSNAFVNPLEKQTGSILRNNYIGIEVGILH